MITGCVPMPPPITWKGEGMAVFWNNNDVIMCRRALWLGCVGGSLLSRIILSLVFFPLLCSNFLVMTMTTGQEKI